MSSEDRSSRKAAIVLPMLGQTNSRRFQGQHHLLKRGWRLDKKSVVLDVDTLLEALTTAGQNLGGTIWNDMESYAIPELNKIAVQIVAIEKNVGAYTPADAQALLDMQLRASVSIIVVMTALTMLAVQNALNQVIGSVKAMVNEAIGFALID